MRDQRLDKLADVLVKYSTGVKPGDEVAILADPVAMPLVEATFEAALRAGGHPYYVARPEALHDAMMELGSEEQLRKIPSILEHVTNTADVRISFWADINTRSGQSHAPGRMAAFEAARRPLMKRFLERFAAGELRWVGTLFPTPASAQDAEMSLREYERFVFAAGLLHLPDPAAAWQDIFTRQELVRAFLQGKKEVRFHAPAADGHDGTDLRVSVDGGTWINCSGKENFPDGEVFCGPQGADGRVNYTYPAVYNGREVDGVRLVFRGGRVVEASAKKNEAFLIEMLDQDEGARNMGEIAIGTNYAIGNFTRNTLFDEKIGGTFHAAVGAGYPESGSTNESGLHWDMVCDLRRGGAVAADGEVFHRDGRFLREGWPG